MKKTIQIVSVLLALILICGVSMYVWNQTDSNSPGGSSGNSSGKAPVTDRTEEMSDKVSDQEPEKETERETTQSSTEKETEAETTTPVVFAPVVDGWQFYSDYTTNAGKVLQGSDISSIPFGSQYYYMIVFYEKDSNPYSFVNSDFNHVGGKTFEEFGIRVVVVSVLDGLSAASGLGSMEISPDFPVEANRKYYSIYYATTLPDGYVS